MADTNLPRETSATSDVSPVIVGLSARGGNRDISKTCLNTFETFNSETITEKCVNETEGISESSRSGVRCAVDETAKTVNMRSTQVALPLLIRVEILKRLENGVGAAELAEKYGVSAEVIRSIEKDKKKLVDYVNEAIRKGDESALEFRQIQPVCKSAHRKVLTLEDLEKQQNITSALPVKTRFEIIKKLENGEDIRELASKYGVRVKTIRQIGRVKNEIVNYVNEVIKRGDISVLELLRMKSVPKKIQSSEEQENKKTKRSELSLMMRVEILKKLENGEDILEIAKNYGIKAQFVRNIGRKRKQILEYVDEVRRRGDENALKLTRMKLGRTPLQKRVKILEELEKGLSKSEISKKFGVSESTVDHLRKKRRAILNGQRIKKKIATPLSVQTRLKVLDALENGETASKLAIKYDVGAEVIRRIERQKSNLLNYVKEANEKGDERLLKFKHLKKIELSFQTKVNIIQELDKGDSLSKVAEKYNVWERTIERIISQKETILAFVKESIEKGDKESLKKQRMRQVYLSPKSKIELLEDLENGASVPMLVKKYGVAEGSVGKMRAHRNEILKKLNSTFKKSKETDLKMRIKRLRVSLHKKAKILKKLREGKTASDLSKKYNMSLNEIQSILLDKGEIIEYTGKSIKKKKQADLPKKKICTEEESDECPEDNIPLSNIRNIMMQKDKRKSTNQEEQAVSSKEGICTEEESDECSEDDIPLSNIRSKVIRKNKIMESSGDNLDITSSCNVKNSDKSTQYKVPLNKISSIIIRNCKIIPSEGMTTIQKEKVGLRKEKECTEGESSNFSKTSTVSTATCSKMEYIEISSDEEVDREENIDGTDDLTGELRSSHHAAIKEEPLQEISKKESSENLRDVTVKAEENFDDLEFISCKND